MFTIIIRAILIYCIVLLVYRLMGKRQLGQMQPFELVLTLIIADLATIPMADVSIPVLHGVIPLLTLVLMHFVITLIIRFSNTISKVVSGKPVILINPNGIDYKAMKKLNLTIDDIFASLRDKGFFSISQVQYAIMEINGKISVMPKSDFSPVACKDLKINAKDSFVPITLICEGKVLKDNLTLSTLKEKDVENIVKKETSSKIEDVLVLTIEKSGEGYIQLKKGKGKTFQTKRLVEE